MAKEKVDSILFDKAKMLKNLKEKEAKKEAELKKVGAEIEEFQKSFVEAMENRKIDSFRAPGIGTCYLNESIYPNVVSETFLFKDLRKRGAGNLIKESVNYQSLRGYCGECAKTGKKFPQGIKVFIKSSVRIRKEDK